MRGWLLAAFLAGVLAGILLGAGARVRDSFGSSPALDRHEHLF